MDKNYLLSFATTTKKQFPSNLILEDTMRFKDLLFSDKIEPKINQKNVELSNSFIIDAENTNTKNGITKKIAPIQRGWRNNTNEPSNKGVSETLEQQNNVNSLKKEESEESTKFSKNKVSKENSDLNNSPYDTDEINHEGHLGNHINYNIPPNQYPFMGFPMFKQAFPQPMPIMTKTNVVEILIENILSFNIKNSIPNDIPLWYLSLPWNQLLVGPFSSEVVVDMYYKRAITSDWGFKPIDILQFKQSNLNRNDFVNLTLLNDSNWTSNIQDSPMLQYTELYHTSKKLLENSNKSSNSPKKTKEVVEEIKETKKSQIIQQEVVKKETKHQNQQEEIIHNSLKQNKPEVRKFSVADDDDDSDNNIDIKPNYKNTDFSHIIDISKIVDNDNWEVVEKKKKKEKDSDAFYLIGHKPKKEKEKETKKDVKPAYKVDIVSPTDFVKDLMPKHMKEEKVKAEVKVVSNNPTYDLGNNKKKKLKGKPMELDVKLGFKI
jgi:hypothetical protein